MSSDLSGALPDSPEGDPAFLTTPEPDGPTRRCILTRSVKPKEEMLRFVVDPQGVLVPDLDNRLAGRGFWLSPGPDVIETARKKNAFSRVARRQVCVSDDLGARVDRILEGRCISLMGLARKAGQAVVGFEKVKAQVHTQKAFFVLEAHDGAENSREKLDAEGWGIPSFRVLDRHVLGQAFARDMAVHVAILPGGLATRLEKDLVRLGRLRGRLPKAKGAGKPMQGGRRAGTSPGHEKGNFSG